MLRGARSGASLRIDTITLIANFLQNVFDVNKNYNKMGMRTQEGITLMGTCNTNSLKSALCELDLFNAPKGDIDDVSSCFILLCFLISSIRFRVGGQFKLLMLCILEFPHLVRVHSKKGSGFCFAVLLQIAVTGPVHQAGRK